MVTGAQPNFGSASAGWTTDTGSASATTTFFSNAGPWKPGVASAATDFAHGQAALTGNNSAGGSTLSASGMASSPGDVAYVNFPWSSPSASFSAEVRAPSWNVQFALSANTVAVFSAVGSLSAEAVEGGIVVSPWYTSYSGNSAGGQVGLSVSGPTTSGGWQGASDSFSINVGSWYDSWSGTWTNGADSRSGTLGVSFLNLGGGDLYGSLTLQASVFGVANGNLVPVPEPGRLALMIGGLGAVAFVVRRRRRS